MATLIRESAAVAAEVWDGLVKTVDALKSQLEVAAEKTLGNIKAVMQVVSDSMVKLSETSSKYHDALLCPAAQTGPLSTLHFSHFPPRLKAREGIKARQVLVDMASDQVTGQVPLAGESVANLKGKVNKVLLDSEDMNEYKTRAVTHLWNSGILMELDSNEAVEWFADKDVWKRFLEKFHPAASIKPRLYQVIVQFVPLTLRTDREMDLQEIEEANSTKHGEIFSARWIKPVTRHKPTQTCGHIILAFRSPHSANDALAYGLFICQKKVYAEKCKCELLRCLKCHGWGHMAANCGASNDTCGMCMLQHHTSACTNRDRPHCV